MSMLLELANDAPTQFAVAAQVLDAIADSGDVRAAAAVEIDVGKGNGKALIYKSAQSG